MSRNCGTWLLAGICASMLFAGCGQTKTSSGSRTADTSSDSTRASRSEWVAKRPGARTDSIRIGGVMRQVDLKLFDQGFPFTTYYPDKDVKVETASSSTTRTVRFIADFNGKLDRSTYLEISIPTSNLSLSDLKHMLLDPNGFVQRSGWTMVSGKFATGDICPWADEFYFFTTIEGKEHINANLCVGRHKESAFFMVVHIPDRDGNDFAACADLMQRELRWLDDGGRLVKE